LPDIIFNSDHFIFIQESHNMHNHTIKVWDIAVRIFHWSLVICFAIAYFTGDEESIIHIYSGYVILALISFRVLWGFIGSQHARFKDFVYSPKQVIHYAKSLFSKKPKHFLGHNPLGGYMVIALLVSLFAVTLSGLKLYAVDEGKGPLARTYQVQVIAKAHADEEEEKAGSQKESDKEFWEETHEITVNITLFLIALHILGIAISSRLEGQNLVKAMVTGKKTNSE